MPKSSPKSSVWDLLFSVQLHRFHHCHRTLGSWQEIWTSHADWQAETWLAFQLDRIVLRLGPSGNLFQFWDLLIVCHHWAIWHSSRLQCSWQRTCQSLASWTHRERSHSWSRSKLLCTCDRLLCRRRRRLAPQWLATIWEAPFWGLVWALQYAFTPEWKPLSKDCAPFSIRSWACCSPFW